MVELYKSVIMPRKMILIVCILLTGCADSTQPSTSTGAPHMPESEWLTKSVMHEGYPLAIRACPSAADSSVTEKKLHLAILTHHLAKVRGDGMPEPSYNELLADFDHAVHAALDSHDTGKVMIVETFGGKRTYYACVTSSDASKVWLDELAKHYPEHEMTIDFKSGAAARFYKRYHDEYQW